MAKKNKEDPEKQKIKDIQEEIDQQKPKQLQWKELDKYIGQPVWDNREKKWRVLEGYKRMGYTYSLTFSDIADWVSYNDRNLYLEEVDKCPTTNK